MGLNAEMIEELGLSEGDLIEINFKQSNNTTHVSLPVYFLSLDVKENKINYAEEKYYTGGIIQFGTKNNKDISELEEVIKEGSISKVRVSALIKC